MRQNSHKLIHLNSLRLESSGFNIRTDGSLIQWLGERRAVELSSAVKQEYQVVIEFHDDSPDNFERVIGLESKLEEQLASGEVDGNDVGQGVVNIFIITAEPERCFEEAMRIIGHDEPGPRAAAYRDLNEEDYVRLWPEGDATPFKLK